MQILHRFLHGEAVVVREVILVCGPPGGGKTTFALSTGLDVYDRDDPQWRTERQFRAAIGRLRGDPAARAAVIRSGATRSAREQNAQLIGATRTVVCMESPDECVRRVRHRDRPTPPMGVQVAAVAEWFEQYEPGDYPQPLSW